MVKKWSEQQDANNKQIACFVTYLTLTTTTTTTTKICQEKWHNSTLEAQNGEPYILIELSSNTQNICVIRETNTLLI